MSISFISKLLLFYFSLFVISSSLNQYLAKRYSFQLKYLPKVSWGFSVYFLIYIVSFQLEFFIWQVHLALTIVILLSICIFVGTYMIYGTLSKWQFLVHLVLSQKILLAAGFTLAVVMVIQGVYLEFPSDPVHHLLFTQDWSTALQFGQESVYDNLKKTSFTYFINNWLLQNSGLAEGSYSGLNLLTGLLTGLFFFQILKFISLWISSKSLILLGGLSSFLLFGVSDFSFYKYYTLAPVFYTYLIFLETLVLLIISIFKKSI